MARLRHLSLLERIPIPQGLLRQEYRCSPLAQRCHRASSSPPSEVWAVSRTPMSFLLRHSEVSRFTILGVVLSRLLSPICALFLDTVLAVHLNAGRRQRGRTGGTLFLLKSS
ncbi:hypothetical protein BD310DRAFT_925336 [Dichomitus squalens]|uniref:Uncharacterized protein n=1 Tax=Dichomitus squalens TaxID=114155 RepID=A0A4Q9PX99_9APHY|nr:hypothetical protein BD310DRAFT_925336 [Dichomitus squalens]